MTYEKVNDFDLQKLDLILDSGDKVSLIGIFNEITIQQDMFISQAMFCSIGISDTLDLYSSLPIKNNETLHIIFKTPGMDLVDMKLKLYSRENIMLDERGTTSYYTLKFVSSETIANMQIKDSRSYTGKISDMVGAIWSKHFSESKPLSIEPTADEYTLILPFNNPFSHINHLAKKAKRQSNTNDCNFLFFEDFNGWNFISVASMFQQDNRGYFSWETTGPDHKEIADGRDTKISRYRILELDLIGKENFIDETVNGMHSSYMNQTDLLNKTNGGLKYNYAEASPNTTHANPFPLSPEIISSKVNTLSNYRNKYAGIFDNSVVLNRQAQMTALLNRRVRFKVSGSSSTNVGDKIKIEFLRQVGVKVTGDPLNNYRSGFYVVTSVKHSIHKVNGYTMTVEACTDSLSESVPDISNFSSD